MQRTKIVFGLVAAGCLMSVPVYAASHGAAPAGVRASKSVHAKSPAAPHGNQGTTTRSDSVAEHVALHPQLAAKLQPLLPKGMALDQAATGFKNQGQFVAALHVSKNLGIPFADLKTRMTGTDRASLGQAIHQLRPSADAGTAAKHAEHEAHDDLK